MICELVGGMYDWPLMSFPDGSTKLSSSHCLSNGVSRPASMKSLGLMEASRSGNCPDACSCLAYAFRSVLGATILLMCTPDTVDWAEVIESSQNFAVRAGVSKVRKLRVVVPLGVGSLVEHAATAMTAAAASAATVERRSFTESS